MSRWFTSPATDRPRFCVVGSPVRHSRSPWIHARFAARTGRALRYERVEVAAGELAAAVREFRAIGGVGMNVTVPLKEEAWALAEHRRERAEIAGAANTLWFDEQGRVSCDNTDGAGLVRDLERNHGIPLDGARVLVIGAGGAARGIIPALVAARPASLALTNRTASRARELAARFASLCAIDVLPWGSTAARPFDLVVNATSLGLEGGVPSLGTGVLEEASVVYDLAYGPGTEAFARWARGAGAARTLDGLGMLVEQAAESFLIWHGVRPDTGPVIAELRRELEAGA